MGSTSLNRVLMGFLDKSGGNSVEKGEYCGTDLPLIVFAVTTFLLRALMDLVPSGEIDRLFITMKLGL